jgi:PhzF family phenazine biosynthesis protein
MESKLEFYQIDAFTNERFKGNPAAVIYSDTLAEEQMQLIAREMNLSETAFISKSDNADYKLRWFTPAKEVDLCGHATIASLHYLSETKKNELKKTLTFETRSGILNCSFDRDKFLMQIPVPELLEFTGCIEEVLSYLSINRTDVSDLPFIILDNGYLFIGVSSLNALWKLKPDFKSLKDLSINKKEFFDITVFTTETVDKGSSAHLRFFAPYHGIDEDPVTGSACGPLLLVLQRLGLINNYRDDTKLIFEQGDVLNRKGRVTTIFNALNNKLIISGNAITIAKGTINL